VLGVVLLQQVQPAQRVGEHQRRGDLHVRRAQQDRAEVGHDQRGHVVEREPVERGVARAEPAGVAGALGVPEQAAMGQRDDLGSAGAAGGQLQRGDVGVGRQVQGLGGGGVAVAGQVAHAHAVAAGVSGERGDGGAAGEHRGFAERAPGVQEFVQRGVALLVSGRLGDGDGLQAAEDAGPQRGEVVGERGGVQDHRVARAQPLVAQAGEGTAGRVPQVRVPEVPGAVGLHQAQSPVRPAVGGAQQGAYQVGWVVRVEVQGAAAGERGRSRVRRLVRLGRRRSGRRWRRQHRWR
jgi:hypothetical protein